MVKKASELTAEEIVDLVGDAQRNRPTVHSVHIEHKVIPFFATIEIALDHRYDNDEEVWELCKKLLKRPSDWKLRSVLRRRLPNA